jgi:CelD/BcsL family acetyltransferase involved in cellulose biosynthesis
VKDVADLQAALPALARVCSASWKAAQGKGIFADTDPTAPFLADYLQRTSQWEDVVLTTLARAGQVVAYQLSFLHSGKLWFYDTAYDQDYEQAAPGFQLFADLMRTGFHAGVTRIDLGPGLHPYKLRWAEAREPRLNWLGFHRGWRSRLFANGAWATLALRRRARRRPAAAGREKP